MLKNQWNSFKKDYVQINNLNQSKWSPPLSPAISSMWQSVIGYTLILVRLAPYHPLNNLWNSGKRTQKFTSLRGMISWVNDHEKRVGVNHQLASWKPDIPSQPSKTRKFPSTWESHTPFSTCLFYIHNELINYDYPWDQQALFFRSCQHLVYQTSH